MKELSVSEISSVYGGWDATSLLVGIASSKLPPQISIPIAITTEIAIQAKPHMPVKTPIPVLIGPSWNGSGKNHPTLNPINSGICTPGAKSGFCKR
ncbi:hypothetical protein H0S68_24535 (plasmid) [Serratia sp. AXJ-M]|uniref:hypothetical protein n=1 Tax=Serratia sp. AXJ-M TaxID=2754727 RepID=UPI00397CADAC